MLNINSVSSVRKNEKQKIRKLNAIVKKSILIINPDNIKDKIVVEKLI